MNYHVRDGSGRWAETDDRDLAFEIRKLLLRTGASIAIVWDSEGMRVKDAS